MWGFLPCGAVERNKNQGSDESGFGGAMLLKWHVVHIDR
jgi:hypothetical protein